MFDRFMELLNEKGVKRMDVARETGIPASTFSDWKKGKSKPKTDKLQKIANYFGVQLEYLTGESDFKTKTEEQVKHWDETINVEKLSKEVQLIEIAKQTSDSYVRLLTYFQMLNDDGQRKLLDELEDMTAHPKYNKEGD